MFCRIKNSELYIGELRFYSWLFGRKGIGFFVMAQQYDLHKIKGFHNCSFARAISNTLEFYPHGESRCENDSLHSIQKWQTLFSLQKFL